MGNVKTQLDIVAWAYEALEKAVANAPYNEEVENALHELRIELQELGVPLD